MKNIALIIAVLICNVSMGQIKVVKTIGEYKDILANKTWVKIEKSGPVYTFSYIDIMTQNKNIRSFSFYDIDNAYENLYNLIIDGMNKGSKDLVKIELTGGYLWLKFSSMGNVSFSYSSGYSNNIKGESKSMNQHLIDILFGKKKFSVIIGSED